MTLRFLCVQNLCVRKLVFCSFHFCMQCIYKIQYIFSQTKQKQNPITFCVKFHHLIVVGFFTFFINITSNKFQSLHCTNSFQFIAWIPCDGECFFLLFCWIFKIDNSRLVRILSLFFFEIVWNQTNSSHERNIYRYRNVNNIYSYSMMHA